MRARARTFAAWRAHFSRISRICGERRKDFLFQWDERTIRTGLNFTLTTSFGDLNLLGEVAGGGGYNDLLPHSREVSGFGARFRLVNLDKLIILKRAAGRPRDLPVVAELQEILEKRKRRPDK